MISVITKILLGTLKGLVECLGTDLISFFHKYLLVDRQAYLTLSNEWEYLKSISYSIAMEFLDSFCTARTAVHIIAIVESYLPKFLNGKMRKGDWITFALRIAIRILEKNFLKRLDKKKKKELSELKKLRKKNSRNINLKSQKRQLKINFKKKGANINFVFDITSSVLTTFWDILTSI